MTLQGAHICQHEGAAVSFTLRCYRTAATLHQQCLWIAAAAAAENKANSLRPTQYADWALCTENGKKDRCNLGCQHTLGNPYTDTPAAHVRGLAGKHVQLLSHLRHRDVAQQQLPRLMGSGLKCPEILFLQHVIGGPARQSE